MILEHITIGLVPSQEIFQTPSERNSVSSFKMAMCSLVARRKQSENLVWHTSFIAHQVPNGRLLRGFAVLRATGSDQLLNYRQAVILQGRS